MIATGCFSVVNPKHKPQTLDPPTWHFSRGPQSQDRMSLKHKAIMFALGWGGGGVGQNHAPR